MSSLFEEREKRATKREFPFEQRDEGADQEANNANEGKGAGVAATIAQGDVWDLTVRIWCGQGLKIDIIISNYKTFSSSMVYIPINLTMKTRSKERINKKIC